MKISTFLGPEMAKSELLRESVWRKYAERRDGTLAFLKIKPFFYMGRGLLCTSPPPPPPPGQSFFFEKKNDILKKIYKKKKKYK
jgi:hypothetical protein